MKTKLLTFWEVRNAKERAKLLVSYIGMVIFGGLAVYFVMRAAPERSYVMMAISYMSFIAMLGFAKINITRND